MLKSVLDPMSELESEWLVMVDGAAGGNPGDAGCGAVILDESGNVVREVSRYLGRTTNDVADAFSKGRRVIASV